MKKILILSALICSTAVVFGQYKGGLWSYTYDIAIPFGESKDFTNPTSFRGLSISGQGFVTEKLAIGGQFTWNTFYEKTARVQEIDFVNNEGERQVGAIAGTQFRYINSFPLLVTARYFNKNPVFENFAFFGGLGVGTSIIKRRVEIGIVAIDETKWHFTVELS